MMIKPDSCLDIIKEVQNAHRYIIRGTNRRRSSGTQ